MAEYEGIYDQTFSDDIFNIFFFIINSRDNNEFNGKIPSPTPEDTISD